MSTDNASTPSTASMNSLKRHPEFWFDDGNIVLVAQNTAFWVYRGLLAAQSTVFTDMLTASCSASDDVLDGYPIVPLTDSSHDLEQLLRVLLPTAPIHYHVSRPNHPYSFEAVSAVIRLADKYHIESVQDQALRALQRYHFTSDFDAFSGPPDTELSVEPIHAIGAVNLAHLTNMPRMLPLALYKCCCLDDEALRAGWKHADGTVEHLVPADFERCSRARSWLITHVSSFMEFVKDLDTSGGCVSHHSCMWYLETGRDELFRTRPRLVEGCDVLDPDWVQVLERHTMKAFRRPCGSCAGYTLGRMRTARKPIWDGLPEVFGVVVEDWESDEAESE